MKVVKSRAFKDRLKGHKQSVLALYSPYGEAGYLLYSASKDGSVRGSLGFSEEINHHKTVTVEDAKPNSKLLAAKLQLTAKGPHQGRKKECIKKQYGIQEQKVSVSEQLSSAIFSQHSVYGGYQDGVVIEWQLKTGEIKNIFKGHTNRVSNLNIMHQMRLLVSGSSDATIRTWNLQKGQPEVIFKVAGPVNQVKSQNKQIYALVNRNIFYQINIQSNSIIKCIKFSNQSITNFIYYKNNLIFGNIQNRIESYNLQNFQPTQNTKLQPTKVIQGITGWVLQMKINNNFLYCGCDDRKIRVFNIQDLKQIEQLVGHDDGIISIEFADKMLYTGSYDHSIRSWDVKEMILRIRERNMMGWQDLQSKKYEVYYGIAFKNKKKKVTTKKKK